MNDLHYRVGNQIFLNKFQAASEAYRSNQEIYFNLYESAFDQADWTIEPAESWDTLLDLRAQQIASKKRPIILSFSGGTDSYTIYKVFERNNIHISAIFLRYRRDEKDQSMYSQVFELFKKGIYDPNCEIICSADEESALPRMYHNREWLWNTADRYTFSIWGGTGVDTELMREKFGQDVINVIGLDKPRLKFLPGGHVYSFQDDINYVRPMNSTNLECFYITPDLPELHIKQSYLLKNYLKTKFNLTVNTTDFSQVNQQWNPTKFPWLEYSYASGRFGDLGNSHRQHVNNVNSCLIVPSSGSIKNAHFNGTGVNLFESFKQSLYYENYINGFLDVKNDGAGKYLGMTDDNLYNIRMFTSKMYQLSF